MQQSSTFQVKLPTSPFAYKEMVVKVDVLPMTNLSMCIKQAFTPAQVTLLRSAAMCGRPHPSIPALLCCLLPLIRGNWHVLNTVQFHVDSTDELVEVASWVDGQLDLSVLKSLFFQVADMFLRRRAHTIMKSAMLHCQGTNVGSHKAQKKLPSNKDTA